MGIIKNMRSLKRLNMQGFKSFFSKKNRSKEGRKSIYNVGRNVDKIYEELLNSNTSLYDKVSALYGLDTYSFETTMLATSNEVPLLNSFTRTMNIPFSSKEEIDKIFDSSFSHIKSFLEKDSQICDNFMHRFYKPTYPDDLTSEYYLSDKIISHRLSDEKDVETYRYFLKDKTSRLEFKNDKYLASLSFAIQPGDITLTKYFDKGSIDYYMITIIDNEKNSKTKTRSKYILTLTLNINFVPNKEMEYNFSQIYNSFSNSDIINELNDKYLYTVLQSNVKLINYNVLEKKLELFDYQFKNVEVNYSENYNDDFNKEQLIKKLNESDVSGIYILEGVPGSGKSYVIKDLCSPTTTIKKKIVFLPTNLFHIFSDPVHHSFIANELKNSIIIIEDCEKIIGSRDINSNNYDISSLLNISDGILSFLNIKFLLTFNTNLDNIDEALKRKGRLKYHYHFGKLSYEKTCLLVNKLHGVDANQVPKEGMVLTDIFNYEDSQYLKKEKRKVGF